MDMDDRLGRRFRGSAFRILAQAGLQGAPAVRRAMDLELIG
jgi:hypothetical protein